ncbi:MAG: sulfate reduction electron transfer complex DsrMKJOP subunit DsrO [Desulfobulbus sp.]
MDKKRRNFLKIAGISTLAGLGATTGLGRLVGGAQSAVAATEEAATAEQGNAVEQNAGDTPCVNRYGMLIDVRKFREDLSLGERVVQACHQEHNVPNIPVKKDEIKWIWMTHYENAFPEQPHLYLDQTNVEFQLPILCNHCDNPPCVRVCPTKATFRDANGVVIMDFHRCIGCRFCMAACPYGSRSFNWSDPRPFLDDATMNKDFPTRTRGVVEKCNFCTERTRVGLQPACVEACGDTKAIVFGNLNDPDSEIRQMLKQHHTVQRNPSLGTFPSVFYIV